MSDSISETVTHLLLTHGPCPSTNLPETRIAWLVRTKAITQDELFQIKPKTVTEVFIYSRFCRWLEKQYAGRYAWRGLIDMVDIRTVAEYLNSRHDGQPA